MSDFIDSYTKLRDFAQKRLDDSCNNDGYDIRYRVGYLDGLDALYKAYRREIDWSEAEE